MPAPAGRWCEPCVNHMCPSTRQAAVERRLWVGKWRSLHFACWHHSEMKGLEQEFVPLVPDKASPWHAGQKGWGCRQVCSELGCRTLCGGHNRLSLKLTAQNSCSLHVMLMGMHTWSTTQHLEMCKKTVSHGNSSLCTSQDHKLVCPSQIYWEDLTPELGLELRGAVITQHVRGSGFALWLQRKQEVLTSELPLCAEPFSNYLPSVLESGCWAPAIIIAKKGSQCRAPCPVDSSLV